MSIALLLTLEKDPAGNVNREPSSAFTFFEVFLMALEALLRVLSISLVLTWRESGSVHWIMSSWLQNRHSLTLNMINHELKWALHVSSANTCIILSCQNSNKRRCAVGFTHGLYFPLPPHAAVGCFTSRALSHWYSHCSGDPVKTALGMLNVRQQAAQRHTTPSAAWSAKCSLTSTSSVMKLNEPITICYSWSQKVQ